MQFIMSFTTIYGIYLTLLMFLYSSNSSGKLVSTIPLPILRPIPASHQLCIGSSPTRENRCFCRDVGRCGCHSDPAPDILLIGELVKKKYNILNVECKIQNTRIEFGGRSSSPSCSPTAGRGDFRGIPEIVGRRLSDLSMLTFEMSS